MTVLTVSQVTQAIKTQLEQKFNYVQIKGEISNLKIQASGHIYFTLKDAGAQLSSVLFRGNARFLTRPPKDGDEVVCKGELSVYAPRGQYQMIVREVQYSGVGDLLMQFHMLKQKLAQEGLFAPEHKKQLPAFPKTIGVVTSPTGAVIQDILNVLKRRAPKFHLILYPVKVQGAGASQEIAEGIQYFNEHRLADVLIVGRGGGSLEDLWPFNEEKVSRAVHASQIPIISAVGHETDTSLCDYVADVRAPTPSAAAEIVMCEQLAILQRLLQMQGELVTSLKTKVQHHRLKLDAITRQPALRDPYYLISQKMQRMDEMSRFLEQRLTLGHEIKRRRERLISLTAHLKAIDPQNLLKKGYTLVFNQKDNSVIMSSKSLNAKDQLKIRFADGETYAEVK